MRRPTRGMLFSGQTRSRRDDVMGVIKNSMGYPWVSPSGLIVPPIPLGVPSAIVVATAPVSQGMPTLPITVSPVLSAPTAVVKYVITYNGNGNTGGTVPTDPTWTLPGNAMYVMPNHEDNALVKSGKTFSCWNTAADGSGTDYHGFYGATDSLTGGTPAVEETGLGTAANLCDNNIATYFTANGNVGLGIWWFSYDYGVGVTKIINYVRSYDCNGAFNYVFQLQWSDDNSAWTTVGTSNKTGYQVWENHYFPASTTAHRYWRIAQTTNHFWYMAEFEFMEATGSSPATITSAANITLYAKWV